MENQMKKIAECLGVTLCKHFYVEGLHHSFVLTNNGLFKNVNGITHKVNNDTLELLLLGTLKLDSRFLPDKGEVYYIPTLTGIECKHWNNNDEDNFYFDNFLLCQTDVEAKELLASMLKVAKERKDASKKTEGNT